MVTTLPDNWFRNHNPEEIIAQVAKTTLTIISLWNERELRRVGWLDNPIIDILYSMTSAGVWIARTDTIGRQAVVEGSASIISQYACRTQNGEPKSSEADGTAIAGTAFVGWTEILPTLATRAGGAVPNTVLVAATAAKHIDTELYLITNKTGEYTVDMAEDHAGTPAAIHPDMHGTPLVLSAVAGQIVGPIRVRTLTNNKNLGIVGATSAFPADGDTLLIYGRYRKI